VSHKKRHCFGWLQLRRISTDFGNFWQKCCQKCRQSNDTLFSRLTYLVLLHYLGKPKVENCVFSLKRWMLFCQQTQKTHPYYLGHSWTILYSHKNQPYVPNKSYQASIACTVCYHTLIVYQVCRNVDCWIKSGSCSLSSLK